MPVEIRELVIKAVVGQSARQPHSAESGSQPSRGEDSGRLSIEEIVTEVLQAIEEHKNER
jgi:hypothetical protein